MTITAIVSHDIKDWDIFREGFKAHDSVIGWFPAVYDKGRVTHSLNIPHFLRCFTGTHYEFAILVHIPDRHTMWPISIVHSRKYRNVCV